MPFVTEEIWRRAFPGEGSIHVSTWPDFESLPQDEEAKEAGSAAVEILSIARRYKTESKTSLRTPIAALIVEAPEKTLERLRPALADLAAAAVADEVLLGGSVEGGKRYDCPAIEGAVTILAKE